MNAYICLKCNAKFLECDLSYTKVSENQVGNVLDLNCKKCGSSLILRGEKKPFAKQQKKELFNKEEIEKLSWLFADLDENINMF